MNLIVHYANPASVHANVWMLMDRILTGVLERGINIQDAGVVSLLAGELVRSNGCTHDQVTKRW